MMPLNELIVLGSGTSTGTPMLNCSCPVCTSSDRLNHRLRSGLFLKTAKGNHIVVDTTPDLRYQLLREHINQVDAAIITHDHADHLHGIDDLRPFTFGPPARALPIYAPAELEESIANRFPYIFKRHQLFNSERPYLGGGLPLLDLHPLQQGSNRILNEDFDFFRLPHGHGMSFSLAHQGLGYIIDCHQVPRHVIDDMRQRRLRILIIDCLQEEPHSSHLTRAQAFAAIEQIAPERAYLIHMNHHFEHHQLNELARTQLSVPTQVAYDRLRLRY